MKLHLDRTAFLVLIDNIHKRTGYREDVLEKDYYVTLILKELADKQANGLRAYFKGGTALYKALKTTNRFSEDMHAVVSSRFANGSSRIRTSVSLSNARARQMRFFSPPERFAPFSATSSSSA